MLKQCEVRDICFLLTQDWFEVLNASFVLLCLICITVSIITRRLARAVAVVGYEISRTPSRVLRFGSH